jgi:hypothetical protein
VYFNFGWFTLQGSVGAVAGSGGGAGYYVSGNFGPSTGGGFKFAVSGALSTAPTINDLNGQGVGVSAMASAAGSAGSFDWSKGTTQAGQTYNSIGGSVGLGIGGGVSSGPSGTIVWCVIFCESAPASAPSTGLAPTAPSPMSSISMVPVPTTQGSPTLGDATAYESQPSVSK